MTDALLALPVVIPLVAGVICLLAWKHVLVQRFTTALSMTLLFGTAIWLLRTVSRDGILVSQVGSWSAPFGIVLVADLLSAIMVVLGGIVGLAVTVYSFASIDRPRESHGYYPLLNGLLMGVSGSFLTGDLFNLFVWFEVMLIASFALVALGGERAQLDGATKYVTLNLVSSTLFLSAVGMLYGLAGTLNMADLSQRLQQTASPGMVVVLSVLFLVTFAIKAAMFPLFFWLPASYHTPPVAISAVFAGLLTKVGVYALLRTFTLLFTQDVPFTHTLILVLSGFTMVVGVLGAIAQKTFRLVLSFQIVSHIGYMTMGLGLYSRLALAGSIFYVVHDIIVKTNLFLISGIAERSGGTSQLKKLGGLYEKHPGISILFLIAGLSLAGVPPLSGFWAKFFLVLAGLELDQPAIVAVALAVGLLTLLSVTQIWKEAFWKSPPGQSKPEEPNATGADEAPAEKADAEGLSPGELRLLSTPIVALACLTVLLGIFVAPAFDLASRAADQLLDPSAYVRAVLEVNR